MRILCPSKLKEPYRAVISELSKRARVDVEFVREVKGGNPVVLDERGEPATPGKIKELVTENVDFVVGARTALTLTAQSCRWGATHSTTR